MLRANTVVMRSSNGIPITICYERAACAPFDLYPGDVLWEDTSECDMVVIGVGITPPFAKNFIWLAAQQRQFRRGVIGRGQNQDNSHEIVRRASPQLPPEVSIRDLLTDSQLILEKSELKHNFTSSEKQSNDEVVLPMKGSEKCNIRVFLPPPYETECIDAEVSGHTKIEDFTRKLIGKLYVKLGLDSPMDGAKFRLASSSSGEPLTPTTTVGRFSELYLISPPSLRLDAPVSDGNLNSLETAMKYWIFDNNKWTFQDSFVFVVQDVIYWCRPGERAMLRECSIRMSDIREVRRGSLCPHAKRTNPDLCLTIITKQNLCVNFETQSLQDLTSWLHRLSTSAADIIRPTVNAVLAKGATFQRLHIHNEQPTSTQVWVHCQNERLVWKPNDSQGYDNGIPLRDITFIQLGRGSGIFLSVFAQDIDPSRCFSIIASSNSLHLVATSRLQVEDWLSGLRQALGNLGRVLSVEESNDVINTKLKVVVADFDTDLISRLRAPEVHSNDHVSKQFASKAWRLLEAARHSSPQILMFGCSLSSWSLGVLSALGATHGEVMHLDELQELVRMSKAVILSSVPSSNPQIGLQLAATRLPSVLSLEHGPLTRDRLQFCVELALLSPAAIVGPPAAIVALWICLTNADPPPQDTRSAMSDKTGRFVLEERFYTPKTLRRPSHLSKPRAAHSLQPVQVQVGKAEAELYDYSFDFETPLELHLLRICEMCGLDKNQAELHALYHLRHRRYVTEAVIGKSSCNIAFSDVLLLRNQITEAQNVIKCMKRYQKEYERDCEASQFAQVRGETRSDWHARRAAETKRKEETDRLMYVAISEPSLLDSLELDVFCEELIAGGGLKLLVEALKWIPSPEKAGPLSTAKVLLESVGSLICFESALELLEDEGVDFLYGLIFEHSAFIVREGFMLLTTVLELAPNGFVMVHTAAQRVAHARASTIYMRPIQLLGHNALSGTSLAFFNTLIDKAPTDMIRLSLLQALDRAGLFQELEHWPRGKDATSMQELQKFRNLTVSFRPLGPAPNPPVLEDSPALQRANQDAVNLASFLTKNAPSPRAVVVAVTHPSNTFVTDGRAGVHCLNGPSNHSRHTSAGVDALVASFLASSIEDISALDTVASACAIFGQCHALAHKEVGPASVAAATLDALYRFDQQQAAHTLWFKRCLV